MIVAVILIPIVLMAFILGIAFYFIKKTDPVGEKKNNKEYSKTIQGFLPIQDVSEGFLVLEDGKLRKIIECSSTNYDLKTGEEQRSIEMSFQRFLNSINFPISIYLQTREIDNRKRLKILKEEIEDAKSDFPELEEYSKRYINAMSNINNIIGNSMEKKKYIIIPYDEDIDADSLSFLEKDEYIKKELNSRCNSVISGLSQVGVKGKVLNTNEIIELVYATLNRDNYTYSEFLNENEALANIVSRDKDIYKESPAEKIVESSLISALNTFEIYEKKLEEDSKEDVETIDKMKEKYKKKILKGER
jgi:hypothetical protein